MTRAHHVAALCALLVAGGCSFDSAEQGPLTVNSCSSAIDCAGDTECQDGMCVAPRVDDEPLNIALEVKPLRQPDGSDPMPILLSSFTVTGGLTRSFELPDPTRLRGFVRSNGVPIEADITFTPLETIRGIEGKVITVASTQTRGTVSFDPDFTVNLLRGRKYRMVVRPRDANLPPYYGMVTGGGADPSVEYMPDALFTRTVVVKGTAADRTVRVRALSVDTAEPISSTATPDVKGQWILRFLEEPEAFTLEIRSEARSQAVQPPAVATDKYCDANIPPYPVFTANSELLSEKAGVLQVELPKLPGHILFEGSVTLCEKAIEERAPLDSLAISLHTPDLLPEDEVLAAAFEASTTATFDRMEGTPQLQFCVPVIPGPLYDVLATPASSMPCALFNEVSVFVGAPPGTTTPGNLELMLPAAAHLSGTLRTMDNTPLRGAAIDAIALAKVESPYNRSRPASTDVDGSFKLQVDLGSYDVVIKAAPGSGLPWQVRYDVEIGKAVEFPSAIDMNLPVRVQGSLLYPNSSSSNASLKDAVVAAYAIVRDGDSERAVPIGSATADENGRFTLLLPPSIKRGWYPTR